MPNQAPSIKAIKSTYGITRVSTDAAGTPGNGYSSGPVFSPDGSKIAYHSQASNLVAGDTNDSYDVFVKDLATGAVTLVSVGAFGPQGNASSTSPVFSPDGSKIVFSSSAFNLVAGDTNGKADVFVKDLVTGAMTRVSVDAAGTEGNAGSSQAVFSPDGSKIAFVSQATNLAPGGISGKSDIFIKDLTSGALTRITTATAGIDFTGSSDPVFSPDGSKIAFHSDTTNLVAGDTNRSFDIFVKDLTTGVVTRVSVSASGAQANLNSFSPVFSPDGNKIAFQSAATTLVAGDTNGAGDIFVKDLTTGAISRVSVSAAGVQALSGSFSAVFSPDGSKIAFFSDASNLVTGDTNGSFDVFVKDLTTGAVTRVSLNAAGAQGNSDSNTPVFSPDGSTIAFSSNASNLVFNDTNANNDIFIKDFTLHHEDPALYLEGASAVAVNTEPVTVSDADNSTFAGGSLTAELTAGSHAGDGLTLIVSGTPGTGIEVSGASVSYNGTAIGTLSGNGTASLSVALNASAGIAAVQALAGAVGFFSSSSDPTADARTVTFTLVDGSGTAGGGQDTGSLTQTVLVVTEEVNQAPQILFPNGTFVPINQGESLAVSSLFTGHDPENEVLTYYVYDKTPAANSGHFELDGSALQAGTVYTLSAEQYAQTTFFAGVKGVTDDVLVMTYDGHNYSNNTNWNEFHVLTNINRPPQISFPNGTSVPAGEGQSFAVSSLFTGNDLDHDVLTWYVYDKTTAANSGHFQLDGAALQAGTVYTLSAEQYAQTSFVAGDSGVFDDLLVMAYDGQAYSNGRNWKEFFVNAGPNQAPQISLPNGADVAAGEGQSFAASSLFAGTDAEHDVLTYYVYDNTPAANSGHFELEGSALQAGTVYTLSAAQYAQTTFVAGDNGVSDDLLVMAYDGHNYSNNTNWSEFHVNAGPNQAPQISLPNGANIAASAGQSIAASNLFIGSDAENDVLTYYVYDKSPAADSGHFEVYESVLQAGTVYTLSAAQLAETWFVAGDSGATDDLLVMAYDGHSYSNNTNWSEFHILV